MEQLDPIMQQVVQSAANHEGTLTSVKISLNDGAISISTGYTMNGNDGPKPTVDGTADDSKTSFVSPFGHF